MLHAHLTDGAARPTTNTTAPPLSPLRYLSSSAAPTAAAAPPTAASAAAKALVANNGHPSLLTMQLQLLDLGVPPVDENGNELQVSGGVGASSYGGSSGSSLGRLGGGASGSGSYSYKRLGTLGPLAAVESILDGAIGGSSTSKRDPLGGGNMDRQLHDLRELVANAKSRAASLDAAVASAMADDATRDKLPSSGRRGPTSSQYGKQRGTATSYRPRSGEPSSSRSSIRGASHYGASPRSPRTTDYSYGDSEEGPPMRTFAGWQVERSAKAYQTLKEVDKDKSWPLAPAY